MGYTFNPFTGNFDQTAAPGSIPDPLTVDNLTVNTLLTAAHIHGNVAGSLYIHVKNTSNTTLAKGTPVYAVGAVGDTTTLEVAAADSANAAKSPAIGILDQELIHNASGHAVMFGEITGVNTGSYAIGDELYLASGGGLTSTRPASGYVQSLAVVGRVHASTGTILVWAASEVPPTDLAYNAATRQLTSSTGTDVTLPLAGADAGLMSAADKQQLANLAAWLAAPQLGGDLDVLTRKIFTSITNGDLVLEPNGSGRLKLDKHFLPNADAPGSWGLRTDGAGNLVFGAVDRWGLTPVGSETIGTPGDLGFGIADPLFTENQFTWLSNFLKATQARVTDLETKVAVLYDLYLREVSLRNSGLTIGVAGAINFGVGPAATTGTPVGISEQDYYPVHANSDSLM